MARQQSLKSEILFRLVIPLIFFVIADAVLSYFVTLHYVDEAYDRWLLDSARSLVQDIKLKQGKITVELPPAALAIFNWDEQDRTSFKIISNEQELLAGDPQVPEPFFEQIDWQQPVFFYSRLYDEPVRMVSMRVTVIGTDERLFVHVAETLNKRLAMMTDILLADLLPQIVFVLITGLYLLSGLKRGLKPLHQLAEQISQRSPGDLSPIPDTHVFQEVRALTGTINTLLAQLNQAIIRQQRFITNAAHQLRTPLAGLKLQAERALRETDLAAMRPALAQIQGSADRMSHLTSQLLVLARSEPLHGSQQLQPVELRGLVRQTCMDWVPKALHRGMELSFDSSAQQLTIYGDAVLLRELLANLLDNAIAYGHPQGSINVALTCTPCPCLTVTDDGPGINETELEKVQERFYRISGSPGDGCGLGLAIVKEIAELHRATLKLERASDRGGIRVSVCFNH